MSLLRTVIFAVVSMVALASLAFGASPLGDVGEQAFDYWDASDDPEEPSEVTQPGTYSAFLHAPEDQDWYELDRKDWFLGNPGDPACVAVDFKGDVHASSHIWVPEEAGDEYDKGEYYVGSGLSLTSNAPMALVVPSFSEVRFGLASEPVLEDGSLQGSGAYNFSIAVHTLSEVADKPHDQDGLPTCLAPSIKDGEPFEYAFELDDPSSLTFSATKTHDVQVDLVDPDGETETLVEMGHEDIIGTISLDPGEHHLKVTANGEVNPFMGFSFGPDDDDDEYNGRPCEPNC